MDLRAAYRGGPDCCCHPLKQPGDSTMTPTIATADQAILPLEEIADRLETLLERATADETELVWLEAARGEAHSRRKKIDLRRSTERTVLVRVLDRGRVGSHRTGSGELSELESAVRLAVAQSRSRDPLPGLPHLPAAEGPVATPEGLRDPAIGELSDDRVRAWLAELRAPGDSLDLTWCDARVAVFNSRGVRCKTAVTSVALEAWSGRGTEAGRAGGAARSLDRLAPAAIVERARQRRATGEIGELPTGSLPLTLAPEAVASLCDILNRVAFSAVSYYDGSSFLRQHLNVQVFDRLFSLRDDGTDPAGLPFPFDLEGTAKQSVDLIQHGTPRTPALDQRQAALLGLPPTAHAIAGNDARAMNLFMAPGEADDGALLEAADGGIWVGAIDHLECFEPGRVQIRAHARGVRRVRDGRLAEPLPDLLWEDGLLRAFSSLAALGSETVRIASPDGYLGGISAPGLAINGVTDLRTL